MEAFLAAHPEAEAARRDALDLDLALAAFPVEAFDIRERILDAIPASGPERFLAWLLPTEPRAWWRPAVAAAVPLMLGVAIGVVDPAGTARTTDWTVEEQSLLGAGSWTGAWNGAGEGDSYE